MVARTAAELLARLRTWRRWRDERSMLDQVFGRSDVAAELANSMAAETTGPQASRLRYAVRTPTLDEHLLKLAFRAVQPSVRAVFVRSLIDCRAEWHSGTAWRWIDKSIGVWRRETVFEHRPVATTSLKHALIQRGISDRSAAVRKLALTGIIRHLLGTAESRVLAAPLNPIDHRQFKKRRSLFCST